MAGYMHRRRLRFVNGKRHGTIIFIKGTDHVYYDTPGRRERLMSQRYEKVSPVQKLAP